MITTNKIKIIPRIEANIQNGARACFIFAGQSNVDAYQFTTNLESEYQIEFRGTKFYQHSATQKPKFVNLNYSDNTKYQAPNQTERFAFQFYLYPELKNLLGEEVYIVHHATGGTSLVTNWLSTGTNNYYTALVAKTRETKNLIYDADKIAPVFRFFYWGQGEADAAGSSSASAYETNLTNFINNFRAAVGISDLPFLIGRINSNIDAGTYAYWNTVRTAQTNVAGALSNVFIVNQDDAEMAVDNVHYTLAGYKTIKNNILSVANTNNLLS